MARPQDLRGQLSLTASPNSPRADLLPRAIQWNTVRIQQCTGVARFSHNAFGIMVLLLQ